MRTYHLYISGLIILFSMAFSCNNADSQTNNITELSYAIDKYYQALDSLDIKFEEQIDDLTNGKAAEILTANGMKLIEYKKRSSKTVKEDTIDEIIACSAIMPSYEEGRMDRFILKPVAENGDPKDSQPYNDHLIRLKDFLNDLLWDDIEIIDMYWEYNGNEIKTISLVSKSRNCIIFDNILYFVIVPPEEPAPLGDPIIIPIERPDVNTKSSTSHDTLRYACIHHRNFGWEDEPIRNTEYDIIALLPNTPPQF